MQARARGTGRSSNPSGGGFPPRSGKGNFTPFIGYSKYNEKLTDGYTSLYLAIARQHPFRGIALGFQENMDLKTQFDSVIDYSAIPFTGNAKLLSVSSDAVF